ncbi:MULTISPECIES: hypothetical protein [unclassified Siphonobacter]|uniref:hypothetical protein n=1 Tax=unclassified Siphonobacter TaxID=2635712 RepID=UPI001305003F|nr:MULTISPECIES: hypothetical protein [unclassified Siphonobacter]
MKIYPDRPKRTPGKADSPDGLTATEALMQKIAILLALGTVYFFFIKLIFL